MFVLTGTAVFRHFDRGVSALLFGWRDALPIDQTIDMSVLGVNFGVYDPANKFADSSRMAFEHIFVSWLDDNRTKIEVTSSYATERNRWVMIVVATARNWRRSIQCSGGILRILPPFLLTAVQNGGRMPSLRRKSIKSRQVSCLVWARILLPSRPATIDREVLPGDVTRRIAGEEDESPFQFPWLTHSPHWRLRTQSLHHVLRC